MFSQDDGQALISIARDAIASYLSNSEPKIDGSLKERFSTKQGGFVTLTMDGELRGCIGYTDAIFPLWETIVKAARGAAFDDPRFDPVQETELDGLKLEISVLSAPKEILGNPEDYTSKIEIGKHGIIVKSGPYSGLLLPQVFTEHKATPEQALAMTCQKAGVPEDTWKRADTIVKTFSAEIINEKGKENA